MQVYFYHTQDIQYCLRRMQDGEFPSHFLYGACHLGDCGIDVVWHRSPRRQMSRLANAVRTAWQVMACRKRIDAVYATHYKGLELLIMLRALGLFGKPIVVWHHQPVITPHNVLREWGGRLFYRGMDRMIFFSRKLVNDSLRSPKARKERLILGHWGADLDFYDRVSAQRAHGGVSADDDMPACQDKDVCSHRQDTPSVAQDMASTTRDMPSAAHDNCPAAHGCTCGRTGFIATGKEMRDQHTLIEAFNRTGRALRLFIGINPDPNVPNPNLEAVNNCRPAGNIEVVKVCGLLPYEIALEVDRAACVAICCKPTRYTAGLTTLVEALALGLPVICSRNAQMPVDIEAEGCGIAVDYGDVEGWCRAIEYMATHPEEARLMGEKGRAVAESRFNDRQCAREVAEVLRSVVGNA